FASIATSSPDAPNQFKRPSPGSGRPPPNSSSNSQSSSPATGAAATTSDDSRTDSVAHRALLRNELLKDNIDDVRSEFDSPDFARTQDSPGGGLFKFGQRTPSKYGDSSTSSAKRCLFGGPLSDDSQRLLKSPRKPQRKVPKNPYKVLDAPELQDDFYLNLVDWSSQNMLSVGLNTCVYLWSACNSQGKLRGNSAASLDIDK
ncbi:unnamed protein product, partial [Toxocara canis]|uniref:WD_REPEATS_REGION domain-containing protein n=1 Tax=Toxocara canis TaxID=6265 RepID=A0A183U6A1_TOXCA